MSNAILNTDFLQPKDAWDALPLQQKAEMMRVAIRNGIHDLPTIRQKYNEFAEGGIMEENLYAKGGPKKQYGNAGSQKAMQFFMNKGLTQAQAAGLVGNLMRESGMQSTALNSSSKAYGIAQWLGPRKKALFAKYGNNPTFDQQLDFVWHELNTTHKNGLRHLKASKTAAEAARNVMGYYEFSAGPEAAIAAMNKTGQAGNKSMQIGIENASKLLGVPVPTGEYVQQEVPVTTEIPQNTFQFTPWNPQVFYGNQTYQAPQIELPLEQTIPETTPIVTQEQLEKAEKQQGLDAFAALSNLFQPSSSTINTSNVLVNPQKRTNPYVAYQNGGNLFDWGGRRDVYNNKRIYDILPKLYALDGVNTVLSSGKRPGSVVIENGKSTGRVSRHASGQAADIVPGKGSTFADMFRVLRDPNSHVSRYLQSLGGGYIDETSATGTTKYWHDHDRDHSHIHHQIGGGAAAKYKSEIASILKGNAPVSTPAVASTQAAFPTFDFVPSNPQAFFTPIENFQQPIERPVIQAPTAEDLAREQRMQEIEERRENLNRFGLLLGLSSPSQGDNSLMQTIGLLSGNMSAHGGHIHIAPSKKGTFTAAATKHGMGVQEFASKVLAHPENYSPAMRKKANFARNASKWHGLGGHLYDGLTEGSQQMETGKGYWSQLANKPTWLDTFITPVNGGQLSEVVVKPTNDESWLFSLGKYTYNSRKPLADPHARRVVANYLSRFDNESAKDYNARISRLADTLDIGGVQFIKNNVESGKLKNRAHYDNKSNTAYIDDMQDIFAEIAHPWQDALGNNNMNDEFKMEKYDPDVDRRGGTRYAYPDTFEGETHGFFQPAITEWVETGKIGRSLPLLNEDLSNEKIVPKDNKEVLDSAASWNKQAIDKRVIANPHQLPLTKRIQYSIWDYPLLNKKKALGGNLYDGITEPTQQMNNSYSYTKPLSNVYVDSEGNILDPDVPSARGTIRMPDAVVATPDWKDVVGRYSIASNDATIISGLRPQNTHLRKQAEEGAAKHAAWAKENPGLETAGLIAGAVPFAVAATPAVVGGGELAYPILTNPYVDKGIASAFAGHGLNHAINEGINGWGDAAMTALELAPLGRLAKPVYNASKEGLQYAAKVADNTARYMSPSYDLYRTIGETTPRTTPTYHGFYSSDLTGSGFVENVYTGSPLFEFGQTMKTSPEKAYFMRAPKDVDVLKLGNGKFRHETVGNEILPSGEVNGKFVSYGEPWQEFALGENSALYEFPVGPRRGPSLMATDWKGRPQKYSVDEIYDYMQQEEALRKELASIKETMGDDFLKQYSTIRRNLINEKYPTLKEHIDTSIYGANQTVIPNERWNFDLFLKTPFWKYSENPLSGQVQKELMMRWPEAKHLETPTIEWVDATRTPQITAENAANITPKVNWDADNWFKTISGRSSYSSEEAAELASHVPEYRAIEQRLFDEGKLTLDSNGNIVVVGSEMSPQEYIMRQSEAFQKMNPEHHYVGVSKDLRNSFENEARDPATRNRYEVWTDRKSPKNVEEYAQSMQGGYTIDSDIESLQHQMAIREENYELHQEQLKWKYEHGKISQETYNQDLRALKNRYIEKQEEAQKELDILVQQEQKDPLNGGKVFDVTYPKEAVETPIIDAENNHWARIPFDNVVRDAPSVVTHYKQRPYSNELQTDQIVSAARRNGYGVTHIDNVMDTYDGTMLNETVIGRDTPIKSVLGNTGSFDIESPNKWKLYRSLIPPFLGLGTAGTLYGKQE